MYLNINFIIDSISVYCVGTVGNGYYNKFHYGNEYGIGNGDGNGMCEAFHSVQCYGRKNGNGNGNGYSFFDGTGFGGYDTRKVGLLCI